MEPYMLSQDHGCLKYSLCHQNCPHVSAPPVQAMRIVWSIRLCRIFEVCTNPCRWAVVCQLSPSSHATEVLRRHPEQTDPLFFLDMAILAIVKQWQHREARDARACRWAGLR